MKSAVIERKRGTHLQPELGPSRSQRNRAPALVRMSGSLVGWLYRAGLPMGPNTLLTVRGRKTGQPRTTPVAVVEVEGRRWVVSAYGNVQWVRNLRAAGEGVIQVGGQPHPVRVEELTPAEAESFFRNVVQPYAASRLPRIGLMLLRVLFRFVGAYDILVNPRRAATRFPVFELHSLPAIDGPT